MKEGKAESVEELLALWAHLAKPSSVLDKTECARAERLCEALKILQSWRRRRVRKRSGNVERASPRLLPIRFPKRPPETSPETLPESFPIFSRKSNEKKGDKSFVFLNVHDIRHGAHQYGKDWVPFGLLAASLVSGLWLLFIIHLIH